MADPIPTHAGSLTGELRSRGTPIREFFEDTFPNLQSLKRNWPRPEIEIAPPDVYSHLLGRVGHAFDYYVRLYFDPDFEPDAAAEGWISAGLSAAYLKDPPMALPVDRKDRAGLRRWQAEQRDAEADPVSLIRSVMSETLDGRSPVDCGQEDRRQLARCCLLLGVYEESYRTGVDLEHPTMRLPLLPDWPQLASVVEDHGMLVDDVVELVRLAETHLPGMVDPGGHDVVLNPVLGRGDTVAADADLVVDGCLIDLKTTQNPGFRRDRLFQLLGYVLLDAEDELSLESVGFYRARFGGLLRWDLEGLLEQLASGSVNLSALREEFRGIAGAPYTFLPMSHPARHPDAADRAVNLWASRTWRS